MIYALYLNTLLEILKRYHNTENNLPFASMVYNLVAPYN